MASSSDMANLGEDGFADSGEVKIHYVTKGTGPLVVLIHGIPGFWYDWRHQIPALAQHFKLRRLPDGDPPLSEWPLERPRQRRATVKGAETAAELEALHRTLRRGRPFGGGAWQKRTARRWGFASALRPRGRPRKHATK